MVLDNIREAVITHSTKHGIKYFNAEGKRILKSCVSQLGEEIRGKSKIMLADIKAK